VQGEKLNLLNGTQYSLTKADLIIADDKDVPIDLAGIMGGRQQRGCSGNIAYSPGICYLSWPTIRRTSSRLGLRTEASNRFEKSLDPELAAQALRRAVYLLQALAGSKGG
jgi:phenylalanyl-tRNA synthetase beta chain